MNPVEHGDRIELRGVRAVGRHGVLAEERERGQEFVVDLDLVLPLGAAAATDRVEATVHYGELAERVADAIAGDPVDLIETLAERVASIALADPLVTEVEVVVHKPAAPITVPFADVAVRIRRTRGEPDEPVVIALGANLGDRAAALDGAVAALGRLRGLRVDAVSTRIETVAVTAAGPDPGRPRYANQVLLGRTSLPPAVLLADLHQIERAWGRVRTERWGDRTLDLDLVAQGDRCIDGPGVVLPHPRAHERAFVLAPWAEVDPAAVLPGRGPVAALLAELESGPPA